MSLQMMGLERFSMGSGHTLVNRLRVPRGGWSWGVESWDRHLVSADEEIYKYTSKGCFLKFIPTLLRYTG